MSGKTLDWMEALSHGGQGVRGGLDAAVSCTAVRASEAATHGTFHCGLSSLPELPLTLHGTSGNTTADPNLPSCTHNPFQIIQSPLEFPWVEVAPTTWEPHLHLTRSFHTEAQGTWRWRRPRAHDATSCVTLGTFCLTCKSCDSLPGKWGPQHLPPGAVPQA